jgi:Fe-S-cluster containining protein
MASVPEDSAPSHSSDLVEPGRGSVDTADHQPPQDLFDCLACGRCCYQRQGTILVTEADLLSWHRRRRFDILDATVPGHFGQEAFQMSATGACIHHGTPEGEHVCAIYPIRAEVCRSFQAGSQQCLEYRRSNRR